tara:strand:+ start:1162 stop:1836 length:675 start_codon:yes stop_codon:yes gene_type:complete
MNWIRESFAKSKQMRNHYKMHEIDIFIKDALPKNIEPNIVFSYISKQIPSHFFKNIDIIYIGHFDMFKEKQVNAIFQDGAIYVTNKQDNHQDLIDDIIHEIAHAAEESYRDLIYKDEILKNEFLGKRKRLYWILQSNDYKPYAKIQNTYHYDKLIDMYFYKEVGYEAMWNIVSGLFPTPYSATSLREYFAIGFEEFYIGDKKSLKRDCPILYYKIAELDYMEGQ